MPFKQNYSLYRLQTNANSLAPVRVRVRVRPSSYVGNLVLKCAEKCRDRPKSWSRRRHNIVMQTFLLP